MAEKVTRILCAVRGGPESRDTVSLAVDLALEHKARLTFVHVMDAEFLNHATIGPLSVVYRELVEMGQFTMLILVDRAQRRGVDNVDFVIREGNIHRQLRLTAIEVQAEMLIMGRPTRGPTRNVFRDQELDSYVERLAEDANLTIIFPEAVD